MGEGYEEEVVEEEANGEGKKKGKGEREGGGGGRKHIGEKEINCTSIYLSIYLLTYLSIYIHIYLVFLLAFYLAMSLSLSKTPIQNRPVTKSNRTGRYTCQIPPPII